MIPTDAPAIHRCMFTEAGLARLCSAGRVEQLAGLARLAPADVDQADLVLYEDERLTMSFAPFDHVNTGARVVIVGLTPGRHQAHLALTTAAAELAAGADLETALTAAVQTASFAGRMRANLVLMLDGIGLGAGLELGSAGELFAGRTELVSTTSALAHPVFVRGQNYSGAPAAARHPQLGVMVRQVLAANLAMVPDALVVPLGRAVDEAMPLADVDPARVLRGFPHPSPGNGHRAVQWAEEREQLTRKVAAWFG